MATSVENTIINTTVGVDKDSFQTIDEAIAATVKEQQLLASVILPKFDSFSKEREHRLERLVAGFRLFAKLKYDEGVAGHITARDPENPHQFWVNPFGVYFGHITVKDLILVDSKGNVVHGTGVLNKAAFVIHGSVHVARPDVVAAVHSHSTYGKAWSTTGRLLQPITQDSCSFYDDHALSETFSGVVYGDSEGKSIVKSLGNKKAIILRNHGLLTVGETIDAALWNFISMERACRVQILSESVGKPHLIDHDTARLTRYQTGTPLASYFMFQPMLQMIMKEQPDIVDKKSAF